MDRVITYSNAKLGRECVSPGYRFHPNNAKKIEKG